MKGPVDEFEILKLGTRHLQKKNQKAAALETRHVTPKFRILDE
jgi:hypothetical protein